MPVKLGSRVPTGVRGPLTPRPEIGRRYSVGRSTPSPPLLSPLSLSPSFVHPRGVVKREKVKKKKTRGLGSGVNGIGNNRGIPCDKHAGNDQAERRFEKIRRCSNGRNQIAIFPSVIFHDFFLLLFCFVSFLGNDRETQIFLNFKNIHNIN